jgi:hypothetical protein
VLYDISLYHSRVNAAAGGDRTRRALQTYYSRGDVPALTNWVILPQRLAEHPEPETARFYSLQCGVQCQRDFAAGGYDHKVTQTPTVGLDFGPRQPFIAVFLQECMGQFSSFGPT